MRSLLAGFGSAWVLLLAAAISSGSRADWWFHTYTVLAALLLYAIGRYKSNFNLFFLALLVFHTVQTVLTIVVGVGALHWNTSLMGLRVQLYYDNPNILGASIAVSTVALVVTSRHRALSWGIVGLGLWALVFTGSRLSVTGLILGLLSLLIIYILIKKPARCTIPLLAIGACIVLV